MIAYDVGDNLLTKVQYGQRPASTKNTWYRYNAPGVLPTKVGIQYIEFD